MEVKLFHNSVALTRATANLVFALKKINLTIARTENHVKFLHRCRIHQVFPNFLFLTLPFHTPHERSLRKSIAGLLLTRLWKDQKAKLASLRRSETSLRCMVFSNTDMDQFHLIWDYITTLSGRLFSQFKERQQRKFNMLLERHHRPSLCGTNAQASASSQNNSTVLPPVLPSQQTPVVNISSRPLSESELSLLRRGLDFIPKPVNTSAVHLATEVELTLHHSHKSIPGIVSLVQDHCATGHRGRDNLTKLERQALGSLRRDSSICIMKADKGNKVVVMDKSDYMARLDMIVYSEDYEKVSRDPSNRAGNTITSIVKDLKKIPGKDRRLAYSLLGSNSRHPAIYGVPKIHKPSFPLRPIISTYGSVHEAAAKFVASILTSYLAVHDIQYTVRNIYTVLDNLKSLTFHRTNYILISFDVVNMFGSLNVNRCREVILSVTSVDVDFETKFGVNHSQFTSLLNICLTSSYFQYKGEFFVQRRGIPMGSPCSPAIADFYLRDVERRISSLPGFDKVKLWNRFVDDVLTAWAGTHRQLALFFEGLNEVDPDIKFTKEEEVNGSLPFLDALLTRSSNGIVSTLYSKHTASQLIINYKSYQHPRIKENAVRGEIRRYSTISDNPSTDLQKLKQIMINSDYPDSFTSRLLTTTPATVPAKPPRVQDAVSLVLPYMGHTTHKLHRKGKKHNISLITRNSLSIGSLFGANFKTKTLKNTNVVYEIPCSCGQIYIGETGKTLDGRIKQHKYAIRRQDPNNGIAVHVNTTDHTMNWKDAKILDRESSWRKRKIKEALYIQSKAPSLNLNSGQQLRNDWRDLLPC